MQNALAGIPKQLFDAKSHWDLLVLSSRSVRLYLTVSVLNFFPLSASVTAYPSVPPYPDPFSSTPDYS